MSSHLPHHVLDVYGRPGACGGLVVEAPDDKHAVALRLVQRVGIEGQFVERVVIVAVLV